MGGGTVGGAAPQTSGMLDYLHLLDQMDKGIDAVVDVAVAVWQAVSLTGCKRDEPAPAQPPIDIELAKQLHSMSTKEVAKFVHERTAFSQGAAPIAGDGKVSVNDMVELLTTFGPKQLPEVMRAMRFNDDTRAQQSELAQALYERIGKDGYARVMLSLMLHQADRKLSGIPPWVQALKPQQQQDVREHLSKGGTSERIANVFNAPLLKSELKRDVIDTFLNLFKNHQVVFVAENHLMNDEAVFKPYFEQLAKMGVKHLGIEQPPSVKVSVDKYLKTGSLASIGGVPSPKYEVMLAFAKAAKDNGIDVDLIDMPLEDLEKQMGPIAFRGAMLVYQAELENREVPQEFMPDFLQFVKLRDEHMAARIETLSQDGKMLVWLGAAHSVKDFSPDKSARALVDEKGISAATIKLEWPYQESDDSRCELGESLSSARALYFCTEPFGPSFAYPTSALGELGFFDPVSKVDRHDFSRGPYIPYHQAAEYVAFLSADDCKPIAEKY